MNKTFILLSATLVILPLLTSMRRRIRRGGARLAAARRRRLLIGAAMSLGLASLSCAPAREDSEPSATTPPTVQPTLPEPATADDAPTPPPPLRIGEEELIERLSAALSADQARELFRREPPAAILTGFYGADIRWEETALTDYAVRHGYRLVRLSGPARLTLFLRR